MGKCWLGNGRMGYGKIDGLGNKWEVVFEKDRVYVVGRECNLGRG